MNTELQNGVTQKNEVGKLSTVYGNINSSQRSTATLTPPDKYGKSEESELNKKYYGGCHPQEKL